jgi:hypothetical protein
MIAGLQENHAFTYARALHSGGTATRRGAVNANFNRLFCGLSISGKQKSDQEKQRVAEHSAVGPNLSYLLLYLFGSIIHKNSIESSGPSSSEEQRDDKKNEENNKQYLGMPADVPAMPPKPKMAAMIATIKNAIAQLNMGFLSVAGAGRVGLRAGWDGLNHLAAGCMRAAGRKRSKQTDEGRPREMPKLACGPARYSLSGLNLAFLVAISSAGVVTSGQVSEGGHWFNVRDLGAIGDEVALDSGAINRAIETCAAANGGQVFLPPGRYLSGTIRLQSHVTLCLAPGARLIGSTNLNVYEQPTPPDFMPEAKWGRWHRGLIIGENLEDVAITGQGIIDGNKVFDPAGEEHMRGPHTIVLVNCRGVTLRDFNLADAGNYAIFFEVCDDVDIRNLKIVGGWDGVHWRGAPEHWCHNVQIVGCQFFTGDDSIAGRYWDQTLISGCLINSSCNGLRLIGPATRLLVNNCLFYGPGQQPHRTSGELRRTNMLSGIILQPGAWDSTRGLLDDVLISDVTMKNVASPLTVWTRPGNSAGRIVINGMQATGVYRSALSIESWAESPVTNIVIRNAQVEFMGGGKPGQLARSKRSWSRRPSPARLGPVFAQRGNS